ncbi:MAG: hypothetical protein M3177_09020, partial [Pseudomonadota bacterium]|nr:hypothetical protein [Pseudomonadota bacterium]
MLGPIALASASAAPAQQDLAGLYLIQEREAASALELRGDGRFRWALTMGALDLLAEGRWRASADGGVVLDTEPEVRPPEVRLLGTGRDPDPGVTIQVTDPSGQPVHFLNVDAEFDSGPPAEVLHYNGGYWIEPE